MLIALLLAATLQAAAPLPEPAKEKKVCRRDTATGSIMAKRICHTRAEWAQFDAAVTSRTDQSLRERANAPASPPVEGSLGPR